MPAAICTCGLLKVRKSGTQMIDGREHCNVCGCPLEFTADDIAGSARGRVPSQMITTLETMPGHRIIEVHGVVTELAATAGTTASSKGNAAFDSAMASLAVKAFSMSATAIVGLRASMFGAAGGITGALGGDAVGVLLMGTAVTVVADDSPPAISP